MEVFAFVASVGSFGELLLKGFSALHRLQTQLSEAPDEIRRISGAMHRLKHVLDEIQALGAPEKELISKKRDTGVPWEDQTAAEIVVRHGMGIDMLELCRIILGSTKAFDLDFLNQSGKYDPRDEDESLGVPMASILIENGADLAICDKVGQSSCLLVFQMPQGFNYFDDVLYEFINLDMLQNLRSIDLWLVASLARSIPSFKSKLEAKYQGMRTPAGISSSIRPRINHLPELDPQKQAS
ncbi:hypothetical protein GCG54_00009515 [Colletotrichum gloeosporioides]|uniref:Fungal N-terminal domain-containing protein n=1 Tax=Colletotrichum gloeosporioides TaxID=474922 RepID=A0A8H4CBR6_COLGL|nr:uncharacterized protein GCG54_00009515 [Colletotrichum gloeosporioides]KAF3800844.1 hypothetical protein GCG54_00009515 [Colletotrichum gloeosporioides]